MTARKASRAPARAALVKSAVAALEDMKAAHIKVMDVRKVTDVADCMILASGNSDRHVRSIADRVVERARAAGFRPIGVEGERDGEWVLVDLNDVIVHVMLPRVREFYGLEELWEPVPARPRASVRKARAKAPAKTTAKTSAKSRAAAAKARPAKSRRAGTAPAGTSGRSKKPTRKPRSRG